MNRGLIFDVGFHSGQDTDYYLRKGFDVIAIDANPVLIEAGRRRFSEFIEQGRLVLLNVGIGQREETLPFYVNRRLSEWSSFNVAIGTSRGDYEVIEVPLVTLRSVVDRYGVPYYIKTDIEGHDMMAIESLRGLADQPQYISVENGQAHMIEELFAQGYRRFKFVNQAVIHKVKLPCPANEGQYVDYTFEFGASGPFGDEIDGDWLNCREVIELSNAYWRNPARDANVHGWYDLHASL